MTTTRRVFLTVVGTCAAVSAVGCGVDGAVAAGNAADVEEGALVKLEGASVLLLRDAGGLYAMTALCTHQGCDLSDEGGVIAADLGSVRCGGLCGHGSVFDRNGDVVQAPAQGPLKHWKVTVDDGEITVEVGTEVPADERA